MEARKKTLAALRAHTRQSEASLLQSQMKLARLEGRVASEIPLKPGIDNDGKGVKRSIPSNYPYDPKALKPLAKMLWAMSVSLGHAMTAHRTFTKLKSSTISPDGMIGGRGYVMSIKDIRKALYDACESLSAISDTIHDELHAPHWKPKLSQLEKDDLASVEHLVGEAEEILDDPDEGIEEDMEEAEKEGPRADLDGSSEMPDGDDLADSRPQRKQATWARYANSSLPVETLPGPRVIHLDRGDVDQTGPFGSYNSEESISTHDSWSRNDGVGNDYAYQSEWDNDLREKSAASSVPTDDTPTEGYDFGLGYGEGNDAHGQGAGGYGEVNSDGRGVYGPSAQLPHDPGGKTRSDESDTTPIVELSVSQSSMPRHASAWKVSDSELPNDGEPPVARSDYYQGPKGSNMRDSAPSNVGSTKLPGEQMPGNPAPLTARPSHEGEHMFSSSELPESLKSDYEFAKDMHPGKAYRYEQGYQPYIKWNTDTHEMRPDYTYQRVVEGPYVKQKG